MRHLVIVTLALFAASSPAFANSTHVKTGGNSSSSSSASSTSKSSSSSHSLSLSSSSSSSKGGNAASNATSTGGDANGQVSNTTERSAAAPALGGLPSGPCTGVSGGLSLGFLPFGFGANGGTLDKQCTLRNNILIVGTYQPAVAMEMLKGLDGYQEAVDRLAGKSETVSALTSLAPVASKP